MARVVADNYSSPSLLPPSTTHGGAFLSPTLAQLLNRLDDARKQATGDQTPLNHALSITPEPRALPFVLRFSNLTYNVKLRSKTFFRRSSGVSKTLLNDISGEARDGEIMAVLGESGSGKSTLIDALANRIANRSLKGKVTLNGEQMESRLLKVISAYVMQDDLLFPMLTVEETLTFAAEFRLPRSLSKSKKKARVEQLIEQLGLRNAAKTIIGDEGHRGVSGGERRRVSIGIDIVHDPIILFLDEPTSGLDSTSAFMVVSVLQRIAHSGSIVIMSVHQPSYRILRLLDQLLFLSCGQMVFSGSPMELVEYFAEFGKPIPENENWTEFALDTMRELEGSPGGTKALVEFHRQWEGTKNNRANSNTDAPRDSRGGLSLKEAISASISRGKLVSGTASGDMSHGSMVPTFANPVWKELVTLSKRSIMNSRRTPGIFGIRFGSIIISGSILATVYWQLDNSPKGIQERLCFFSLTISSTFYTCASTLPVFLQERYIFMRETAHNTYRRSSYVLSHALTVLPSLLLLSLSMVFVTFFEVGLNGGVSGFFFYFCIILASFWAGNSFVSFLSGVISQVMLGYVILIAILAFYMLFSGFFVTRDRIPDYWIWFHYISLMKYPYEGILRNEFEDSTKCYSRGVQIFDNTPLGGVPTATKVDLLMTLSKSLGTSITPSTCLTTGGGILEQQAITQLSKWGCFWITVAWGFFFRILFYFALLFGSKNKRS